MTSNSSSNSYETEYQKVLFQDDQTDLYKTTNILRKLTGLSYNAACQQKSNDATCFILEQHLNKYTSLVDQIEENKINNYSDIIFKIASNYKNESKNWKSNLKDPEALIKEHLNVEKCPINNENECANRKVTKDFLKKLHNNYLEWEKIEKENRDFPQKNLELNTNQKEKSRLFTEKERNQFQREPNFSDKKDFYSNQGQSNTSLFLNDDFRNNITSSNKIQSNTNNNYDFNQPSTSKQNLQMRSTSRPFQPKEHFQFKQNSPSSGNFNQNNKSSGGSFKTAKDELTIQNQKKWGRENRNDSGTNSYGGNGGASVGYGAVKRNLGTRRAANVNKKFQPPVKPDQEDDFEGKFGVGVYNNTKKNSSQEDEYVEDERLRGICPKMIEMVRNEIMDSGKAVTWDDIAGLEFAKDTIKEIVVFPMLRPDIFTGLRTPAKGILLFGPPGTGKTLIGKCIASHSHSTFFNISASSLTSKWIGDGEKMVRALFAVARVHQPSVVFIDEIDSLLTQRSDTEHESSRRIKTEFLVQLDGAATSEEDRILIIGATNRPQELDEAARRRMVKRLYIPLPTLEARKQIVERLLSSEKSDLTSEQIDEIAKLADGYSGADMKQVCAEASLGPIRSIGFHEIQAIKSEDVRPVNMNDFLSALKRVRTSVSPKDLESYMQWNSVYGTEAESEII